MMDKSKLPQALGLEFNPPVAEVIEATIISPESSDEDFDRARDNLLLTLDKVNDAIENVRELADVSQSPRFYEVLSQLCKNSADLSRELMNLHRQRKDLQRAKRIMEQEGTAPPVTQNNLFVGTSNDLLELIKKVNSKDGDS